MLPEKAFQPVVISASRATDIPAFYCDWLLQQLKNGYCLRTNPFNRQLYKISFEKARVFVFWTKNAAPFLQNIQQFQHLQYYFQYTLNDYDKEKWEPHLPSLKKRIDTFIRLSETIGKEKIIWRFDPLILSSELSSEQLLEKVYALGEKIHPYTEKLVFSFVDIENYRKVKRKAGVLREFTVEEMVRFVEHLARFNQKWKLQLATCSEAIDLSQFGIEHNRCIDAGLMLKLFPDDKVLLSYFGLKDSHENISEKLLKKWKDKGQRKQCGCLKSKDIGTYNTCSHGCIYCYANR